MSLCQAIVLQAAVVLVAVDVGLIHQTFSSSAAQLPANDDVCPDWRQTICSLCSSVDPENRCCLDDLTYGLCVDRIVKPNSRMPSSQNKRAKYFLGKRVKYFLGKRDNALAASLPQSASEEEEDPVGLYHDRIREDEKRAKYFLGK